jgi:Uma2 family endonuclease
MAASKEAGRVAAHGNVEAIMPALPQPPVGALVGVHYAVPRCCAGWELPEGMMPESVLHDQAVELLKALLAGWAERSAEAPAPLAVRNLAVRWDEGQPGVGVDPDVCVLAPPPPDAAELRSVRTWLPGHAPPILAVEVVSETNPRKDYAIGPDTYAASGTGELWVFDPLLAGPAVHGGPFRLQLWRRDDAGTFVRTYAGPGPTRSPALGAYLIVTDDGKRLRLANDEAGTDLWLTPTEHERAAKQAALARVAALEAALGARPKAD